jgi:DNA polymerase elongation subunit (family B)
MSRISNVIVFDIETSPLPESELFAKFDPKFEVSSSLKEPTPNRSLKDAAKVEANLAEVAEKRKAWLEDCATDLHQQKQDWIAQGALRAERGQILAFGYRAFIPNETTSVFQAIHGQNEVAVLSEILNVFHHYRNYTFAGFNILDFDLPFIRRRLIANRMPCPFYNRSDKWKPWTVTTYDAMKDWACGVYGDRIKLDDLARGLGIGCKNGSGADFAELYYRDPSAALEYLENDIDLTCGVVEAMI